MRFLIDTHCWLWSLMAPDRLSAEAKELIVDRRHVILLSAASAWEIAIKSKLGKLQLRLPPETYIPKRLAEQSIMPLPIQHHHALRAGALPDHHRDPFDRLLVAQCQLESLPLMTADAQLKSYDIQVIWVGT